MFKKKSFKEKLSSKKKKKINKKKKKKKRMHGVNKFYSGTVRKSELQNGACHHVPGILARISSGNAAAFL